MVKRVAWERVTGPDRSRMTLVTRDQRSKFASRKGAVTRDSRIDRSGTVPENRHVSPLASIIRAGLLTPVGPAASVFA